MLTPQGFFGPSSTRASRLSIVGRLAFILQIILGPLVFSGSAVFAQETWTTLPTINTSFDTSTTVQSKAWFHGHNWWAILPSSTPSNGTWVFRLETNNTWTPVLKVSGVKGRSEAKANGDLTHILIVGGTRQIVTIQYSPALNTYQLWAPNPTPVDVFIGETGSLEVDSTGRLWLATDHFNWVYTYYADYPYSTFTGPIILTDQTGLGDVNQIVSFPNNNTIGVFWGNGALEQWGFRIHVDGTDPNVWLDDEVPALAGHESQEMADDHVNLAVRADGTLYAVVKSKHPSTSIPPVYVLVRRPAPGLPGGVWDNTLYPVDAMTGTSESGSGRRPQIVLNDDTNTLRVFYADSSGNVYFRESDATNINFGPRNQVLTGGHEFVSTTKDTWSGRLVVLATKSGTSGVLIDTNPDLFGYWKMDDGGGTIAKDYSGWGNDATIAGTPDWAPGLKGLAVDFDGSSDYASVSSQAGLAMTTGLTLSAWIKPGAQSTQDIISRATVGASDGYGLFLNASNASANPGKVIFQLNEVTSGNTFRVSSASSYPTNGNTWMHITATYDGTAMRLYVNGVEEESSVGPASIAANAIDVGLGTQANGSRKFTGQMDEVRIYRRALTAQEISALAQAAQTDLRITKTDSVASVTVGQQTTYTIQGTNVGPSDMVATITDPLPSRLGSASWTCTAAGGAICAASGSGSLEEDVTLPVGGSVTFSLQGTVTGTTAGTLVNTATIEAASGIDSAPGNNSATDTDTITVPTAPVITTQPSNVTVTAPNAASFTVVASGAGTLTYQWKRNGSNISGATSATYIRNPTAVSDNNSTYSVVVTNGGGTATSTAATLTVNAAPVAPTITTQPSSVMGFENSPATFSVVAAGTSPLSYQWRRNGTDISGATSSSYTLSSTALSDNGASFSVFVSNIAGSVTSASATLTVFGSGGGATLIEAHFDSGADGFTYADDVFRGTNQPGYASGAQVATGGFTGGALRVQVGGVNSQNIANMSGGWRRSFALAAPAPLTLLFRHKLTEQNTYETDEYVQMLFSLDNVLVGVSPNDYIARVVGGGPTTTGWQLIQLNLGIVPAGNHTLAFGAFNNQKTYPDEFAEVLIDDVFMQGGSSSPVAPSITTPPANATVTAPTSANFSVVAAGTGPLSYQWRRNNSPISGATSSSYSFSPTAVGDSGSTFDVIVSNSAGNVTSTAATLTVNPAPVAPSITTQPASLTVTAPAPAGFSVVAAGTAPLSYQWYRGVSLIPGATSATYTLSPTAVGDNGATFSVVVTNSAGTITSASATLTVNAAPVGPSITTQPANLTVTAPAAAGFSVVAAGSAPLTYQWYRGAALIPGATSSTYTLNPTAGGDNGATFSVAVTNSVGTITSATATLTVNVPATGPSITTQPANLTVTAPAQATFSVVATGTAPLSYQWQRNGSPIGGATGPSYTLNPTALGDNGATFDVVVTNSMSSVTSTAATLTVLDGGGGGTALLEAHFDSGADGFGYADDLFKATAQPAYASGTQLVAGGFTGGGVQVVLGGINGSNVQKISGGWQRSFSVATAGPTTLTFRYKLGITGLKSDRFGQMLVSLNGVLYGVLPNTYIAQLNGGLGGVTTTTGWQQVQINLGSLPAGNYTLALGGYLSGKSGSSETSDVIVDDVVVTQ